MTEPKTVLITGCSEGGLGDALAQRFHISGYRVIATARNTNKLINLFPGIEKLGLDVTSKEGIRDCVAEVTQMTGGTLDILVNNAGAGYMMPLSDADLNTARQLFELNVFAQLAVTQAFLPLILKAKGLIVNQTSIASIINSPMQGIYSASKAAAAMINDTLRAELKPFGVRVVELKTGLVKTNFLGNQIGDAHLPQNSIYRVARAEVEEKLLGGAYVEGSTSREEYAKQVLVELIKENPPAKIWKGGKANQAWAVSTFAPYTAPDHVLAYVGALDVVSVRLNEQERRDEHKRETRQDRRFCEHIGRRWKAD